MLCPWKWRRTSAPCVASNFLCRITIARPLADGDVAPDGVRGRLDAAGRLRRGRVVVDPDTREVTPVRDLEPGPDLRVERPPGRVEHAVHDRGCRARGERLDPAALERARL